MDILVERELESRKETRERFLDMEETVINADLPSDEYYQCSVCKTYVYLSQVTCSCTTNAVCPSHAVELCDCDIATRVYRLRYSDQELKDLAMKISERAEIPEVWSRKFNMFMTEHEKPPLRSLRSLLSEAERIQYYLPEHATLKAFVERVNEWVEEATAFVARKHQNRRKNERVWRAGSRVQELEERDRIQRNPSYVYKLLDQAAELGFDAAEIDLLREKAEAIEEFTERAEKALNEGTLSSLEDYTELIDEGKSLNIDLPVLDRLERITDQLRWVEKATDVSDVYLSLHEVVEIMDEGERCGISPEHKLMRELAARRDKGQWWENAAAHLLSLDHIPFEALEKLLDEATDLSIHKKTYDKVESIIIKAREAGQQMAILMSRIAASGPDNQPPLSEATRLLKVVNDLPVKPSDTVAFRKLFAKSDEWVKHGKRLFGKTNASTHQLEDHLHYVQKRHEIVFDITDVPRREESPSAAEAQDSEYGPYCICRSGPTGEMVECDKCKEWYWPPLNVTFLISSRYHLRCLKISKKKFDPQDGWDCPICDWRKQIPRTNTRPTIVELTDWIQNAESLPFRPGEVQLVQRIIAQMEAWRATLQPTLQADQLPSLDTCRFYLRKIEGAEVFLPVEYNFFRRAMHRLAPVSTTPPPPAAETRVLTKKTRTRKYQTENAQDPNGPPPRVSMRPYDSQPLLPVQRYTGSMEHAPLVYGQHYVPYPPNPSHYPSLPPKGVFAPPSILPSPYGASVEQRPPMDRGPVCGSCNGHFFSVHSQPATCSMCNRYQHTVCIAKYGGRLYPALVWYSSAESSF